MEEWAKSGGTDGEKLRRLSQLTGGGDDPIAPASTYVRPQRRVDLDSAAWVVTEPLSGSPLLIIDYGDDPEDPFTWKVTVREGKLRIAGKDVTASDLPAVFRSAADTLTALASAVEDAQKPALTVVPSQREPAEEKPAAEEKKSEKKTD